MTQAWESLEEGQIGLKNTCGKPPPWIACASLVIERTIQHGNTHILGKLDNKVKVHKQTNISIHIGRSSEKESSY